MRVHMTIDGSPEDNPLNEQLRRQAEANYVLNQVRRELGLTMLEARMLQRAWTGVVDYRWSTILLHGWNGKYRGWWRRAKYGWAVLSDEARDTIDMWLVQRALEQGDGAL